MSRVTPGRRSPSVVEGSVIFPSTVRHGMAGKYEAERRLKGEPHQRYLVQRWNGYYRVDQAVDARLLVDGREAIVRTRTTGLAYLRDGRAVVDTRAIPGVPVGHLGAPYTLQLRQEPLRAFDDFAA